MKFISKIALVALFFTQPLLALAQQQTTITREAELGALITSGNTDQQTLNFGVAIDIDQGQWDYQFTLDGIYTNSDNVVKAQRITGIALADRDLTEYSFFQSRASHEDDRFSGFDSQSDLTFSYGHDLLRSQANMNLSLITGVGVRYSVQNGSDSSEPIFRLAGEYDWTVSESAVFGQNLSIEAGSNSDIYRSETSIETRILSNLTFRFSVNIKHQTVVPLDRKKTDTETALTFVMSF